MKRLAVFLLTSMLAVAGYHYALTADISASNWSQTDASNNSAAPNGAPEGMAPSGVNDVIRANMGALKRFWDRVNGTIASTGSANAYVLTYSVAPSSYATGETFTFRANFANTSTATVNVNSLGAKEIKKVASGALSGLASGDIISSQVVTVVYDGTQFQVVSRLASGLVGPGSSTSGNIATWSGTGGNTLADSGVALPISYPTIRTISSGTGTYTTPTGAKWLHITICGAGGGGGGTGSSGAANGGAGGGTGFASAITAGGGSGGILSSGSGAGQGNVGGTATGGNIVSQDGAGGSGGSNYLATIAGGGGGMGGGPYGGGGGAGGTNGYPGKLCSGGGGASSNSNTISGGGGGGGGALVIHMITSPTSSYSYIVGTGGTPGTAGTNGAAGGTGGNGYIRIEEHYNY